MPILIKDYNWRQTEELIIIRVPLKRSCMKNVDIFTSDNYLKIHAPPFLFEVCLWAPVLDAESNCTLADEEAVFQLVKQEAKPWLALTADLSRKDALEVKTRAIEEAQAKAEKLRKDKSEKKSERQRAAVREQISLQTRESECIEQTRQQEKAEALRLMGWSTNRSSVKIQELVDEPKSREIRNNADKEIFKQPKDTGGANNVSLGPGIRQAARISVTFTPRVFPTPCRESKEAEELEWLSKHAEARRRTGFMAEDLRPEEQDPVWLCDKAQSFYDVGNYLGAISAYTHALTLNSALYELYTGRAAAHLALGNLHKAVSDASKALELLTPPVPQNAEARSKCLLYRGSALAGLDLKQEALGELQAALDLRPDNSDIKTAIAKLQE